MTTNKFDMVIGDNETLEVEITDEDDVAIPLASTKIWFTIRKNYTDEDFIVQKKNSLAGGGDTEIKITDGSGGVCEIYLLPADTKELLADFYVYDVQISNASYGIKTVISNRIFFKSQVTIVE